MIEPIKTLDDLLALIGVHDSLIGIDGNDGVGKSTLAQALIQKVGGHHINIDNHLEKQKGSFFDSIDFKSLSRIIMQASQYPLVIEGVLLHKVLKEINIKTNFNIYVTDSVWIYDWLEDYQGKNYGLTIEKIIQEEEAEVNRINKLINPNHKIYQMSSFRKEVFTYTHQYKPWRLADVVCENN